MSRRGRHSLPLHEQPVYLLTGASTGLGLAIARELDRTPWRVALTARESSLHRFASAGIESSARLRIYPLDVTDADQRRQVVAQIESEWGQIDGLINNAGIAYRSVLEHVNERERLAQMQVNFLGPMHLMRLVLPGMRARRRGRIVNISSVGGMMAMPTMAIYSASKFALEGATEALWYEVRPWGIHVSMVEPGFVNSPSFLNTRFTADGERAWIDDHAGYHMHYESMGPFIARLMRSSPSTPESVARRVLKVLRMRRPPLRIPATRDAHLFSMLRRLLPRRLYHAILYRLLPEVRTWGRYAPRTQTGRTTERVARPASAEPEESQRSS